MQRTRPQHRDSDRRSSRALISSAGVTFRLDPLEQAGLIDRQRDAQDRRVVHSALTDKGLEVINRTLESHLEAEEALLHGLSAREREQLARLLAKFERSILEADLGDL